MKISKQVLSAKRQQFCVGLSNVSKQYVIHHEKPTLVEKFITQKDEAFFALRNINLQIYVGERVGIIGRNGAGKTSLLKIISGITAPTSGIVKTRGNVISFIDIDAGFHPDLTGEQNIYINGLLLGLRRSEIEQKLDDIIKFADIAQFIDAPFYTYSQGMKLRLGFAVAIHADPDILIFDEGIGFGDKEFQRRFQSEIRRFLARGKTLLLATHWLGLVKAFCRRVLVMEKGVVVADGPPNLVDTYFRKM